MPAVTVKDVVLHPSYKKYFLDITTEEIERMRNIVEVYDNWQRLTECITRHGLTQRLCINDHYKECIWSDPNCKSGPDTCVCDYLSGVCYDIIRLLNKLKDEDCATTAEIDNKRRGLFETIRKWWWR